jgi:glycyl-tRNA synthetase beta chain
VAGNYKDGTSFVEKIIDFINVRVKTIFTDEGFRYDEIDASLIYGDTDYIELYKRAGSLHKYRENEKFSQLLLGLKRMNNIVNGFRKDNKDYKLTFSESLLEEKEEKELYSFFNEKQEQIKSLINESRYIDLFELITESKPLIDIFFDKVMVMDKRIDVRDNRLALIESILKNLSAIIDFSRISDK